MRFDSREVRWFFSGAPPDEVVSWFRTVRPWPVESGPGSMEWPREPRDDVYLVLRGRGDLGIKLRDEPAPDGPGPLIEFKGRTTEPGPTTTVRDRRGGPVDGRVEDWVKWSFTREQLPAGIPALFHGSAAQRVRKRRLLRLVRLEAGGEAVEVSTETEEPYRSLAFELTRVECAGREFWTLGLEANPVDSGMALDFEVGCGRLLARWPGDPPLSAERSVGYAAWLAGAGPVEPPATPAGPGAGSGSRTGPSSDERDGP